MRTTLIALAVIIMAVPAFAQGPGAVPVTLQKMPDGWQLLRNEIPYTVNGAGGDRHLELARELGANSIRTWGERQLEPRTWPDGRVMSLPDRCQELGLTICAGYWVQHPRHGFNYDDKEAVQKQIDDCLAFVRKWKDHPAILCWGIGNEVQLEGQAERAFIEIERIAKQVRALDPNHPCMTAIPGVWPQHGRLFKQHCPSVQILGINAYGGLPAIPQELLKQGYDGPYIVTEYGPIGHWETAITPWDAPIEQTSTSKARSFQLFHEIAITKQPDRALGGYAFVWGNKQERTATWYGLLLPTGEKLAHTDMMGYLWSGNWPANRAPEISDIDSPLALKTVEPSAALQATVTLTDPEGDTLRAEWFVRAESTDRRSGGDAETAPPTIDGSIRRAFTRSKGENTVAIASIRVPKDPGNYRLFVYAYDDQGNAATANIPFRVAN